MRLTLLVLLFIGQAHAHRLDEYLQATLIGVRRDAIDIEIQLTPGIAALPAVLTEIDVNRDQRLSLPEQRSYANSIVRDVELRIDGVTAPLTVIRSTFPTLEALREGLGTIRIELRTERTGHTLQFENRHLPKLSVYLVNCLSAPQDGLTVTRQSRDPAQKSIELEYSIAPAELAFSRFWPLAAALLLIALATAAIYGGTAPKIAASKQ